MGVAERFVGGSNGDGTEEPNYECGVGNNLGVVEQVGGACGDALLGWRVVLVGAAPNGERGVNGEVLREGREDEAT